MSILKRIGIDIINKVICSIISKEKILWTVVGFVTLFEIYYQISIYTLLPIKRFLDFKTGIFIEKCFPYYCMLYAFSFSHKKVLYILLLLFTFMQKI